MEAVTQSVVSENGSHVAYTVSVPADPYEENVRNSTHLHVLDVESGTTKPYYTSGSLSSIKFRPGNSSITFLVQRSGDEAQSLYELPLDGGEAIKLFEFERDISDYEWHHDGNHIVFTSFEEADTSASELPYQAEVYEENRPNRPAYITNVLHSGGNRTPHQIQIDGTVYMMQWSPDGNRVAISATPTPEVDDFYMSQQVFVVDYQSREAIAEINNEGKIGQIEWSPDGNRLAIRAASNINDPIDGRILIVSAEGGTPEIIDREFAGKYDAKGYAVFYPNYRGSTGRGIDFAFSSQADLAGSEFDDIVDGIDYLIDQGIADEDRIGVTGGSYGGYASAWMSTYYSDRFAASVMFVGISNNLSKWGSSDIPEELFQVHARTRIWDDWQGMLERSPVYYVDRAETPILIMHGAEDTRVHPSQSLELYRHLKVRKPDLPVRLVWYPGEGHGNTRASSRYDYSHRMLQWFDTYLMTGDASAELPHWDAPIPDRE